MKIIAMKSTRILILLILIARILPAQVAISTDGSSADASAILEIKSTEKGILLPRMTSAQRDAIGSPATGLIIFNAEFGVLQIYDGSGWQSISAANAGPVATNVTYTGTMIEGETLTGSYSYNDPEGNAEGTSVFQWYLADDASGANKTAISGATSQTYVITNSEVDRYISFEVTPVAQSGETSGTASLSSYQKVNYGLATSNTGEVWLDRNLGASQVATAMNDPLAYGDYYQWGRLTDGHELTSSDTTDVLSAGDTPANSDFIYPIRWVWDEDEEDYIDLEQNDGDWRDGHNDNLWQGESGTNNPCPAGFRLATSAEWLAERNSWGASANYEYIPAAFASPLKLPAAGSREYQNGDMYAVGDYLYYWSSTITGTNALMMTVTGSYHNTNGLERAAGGSIRCIKDDN